MLKNFRVNNKTWDLMVSTTVKNVLAFKNAVNLNKTSKVSEMTFEVEKNRGNAKFLPVSGSVNEIIYVVCYFVKTGVCCVKSRATFIRKMGKFFRISGD